MTFHHDTGGLCVMLDWVYDRVPLSVGALVLYSPELAEWERIEQTP